MTHQFISPAEAFLSVTRVYIQQLISHVYQPVSNVLQIQYIDNQNHELPLQTLTVSCHSEWN